MNKVKGHFTTFIWHSNEKRLLIINDWFGRYPLYYAKIGENHFFFASELKALLLYKMVKKRINDQASARTRTKSFPSEILKTIAKWVRITKIFPNLNYEDNIFNIYLHAEKEFV